MRLADIPISAKLSAMLIAACAGVLITACAAFVIFDRISTIEAKESTLGVLTDTVGQTLVGPVAFRDEASTNTVLEKLAAEPTTNSAAVYVDDGQRMTAWTREGAEALPEALTSASAPFGSDLVITRPIASPEGAVGTLVVRYSTADVVARTWRFLAIAGFVLLVSILLASLAAGRLQRLISNPVTTLVDAADRVQKEADYSIRAPVHGKDELGKLAGAFNDMLAGIQARDADLIAHQEGLEATVAERTRDLDQRNAAMRLVLDNVDQGFVTLDANGQLSPERSAAFDAWFGAPEQGVGLAAHLAGAGSDFEGWYDLAWEAIREDFMPLEVSISQLPSTLERDGKTFTLGWQPLLDGEVLQGILVVVSDVTAELERERADQEQRELVRAFRATREDRAGFEGFFTEASRIVHNLAAGGVNVEPALMQRQVHTLKGNAGLFEIGSLVEPCHVLEDLLQQGEPPQQPLVDAIVQAWHGFERRTALFRTSNDEIRVPLSAWEALAADVRSGISGAALTQRLEELTWESVQGRLEGLAKRGERLAGRLGKEVETVVDADVRVPTGEFDGLFSAMVHAVRNAVDHGVEDPEVREESGKPRLGRISLSARIGSFPELGLPRAIALGSPRADAECWVAISLSDDGAGVNWDAIRSKAEAAGLPAETEQDLLRALCADGVSTATAVTDVSGRGAGSSALVAEVLERGGVVQLHTVRGQGSTFRYLVPVDAPSARAEAA